MCTFVLKAISISDGMSHSEKVSKGETVLLPAMIKEVILEPSGEARVLEVFINSENIS